MVCLYVQQTDRSREYSQIASHSYDEINMRTRSIEEIEQGKERDYYDVLHLHNVVSPLLKSMIMLHYEPKHRMIFGRSDYQVDKYSGNSGTRLM